VNSIKAWQDALPLALLQIKRWRMSKAKTLESAMFSAAGVLTQSKGGRR